MTASVNPLIQINSEPSALLRLPTEIKVLIIQLINNQDKAFWIRNAGSSAPSDINFSGRSLNQMFLVNKELSGLAAVHIFKTVKISRTNNPLFKFIVLRRRAHLFKILYYNSHTKISDETLSGSVGWIDSLTNVNEVIINEHLEWIQQHEELYQHQIFKLIAPQIQKLSITVEDDEELAITLGLLRIFSNIEELGLTLIHCNFTSVLQRAIGGLEKLIKFTLVAYGEVEDSTDLLFSSTLTRVKFLISNNYLHPTPRVSWLKGIPYLEHLTLYSEASLGLHPLPPLPSLTTLSIENSSPLFILEVLQSLRLSPISHLKISHSDSFFPSKHHKLYTELLQNFTHLKHLSVQHVYNEDNDLELLDFYQNLAVNLKFQLDIVPQYCLPNFSQFGVPSEAKVKMIDLASKEFYEVLEFGTRKMKRLVKQEDLEGSRELVKTILEMRNLWLRDEKD